MLLVSVTSSAGCTDAEPATGEVSISLVGQAPSGAVYRLRDAAIVVDGPVRRTVFRTEDDIQRTAWEANAAPGNYKASLEPGWRLERVVGASAFTINAELVSPNPTAFLVFENQRTSVPLRFRVAGEDLDLAQGYGVVLEVEEFRCGNGALEGGEQCDDGNPNHFDGCTNTCRRTIPRELEPNDDGTPSPSGDPEVGNDFARTNADFYGPIFVAGGGDNENFVIATLSPIGDEDVYPIKNSATTSKVVLIETFNESGNPGCGISNDTVLVLRDANGEVMNINHDRTATDLCSAIQVNLSPGEQVYAQVLTFGDGDGFTKTMPYMLEVSSF